MVWHLGATVRLSEPGQRRTAGLFSKLILENAEVFREYFGVDLFPGSLNLDAPHHVHGDLDGGRPKPAFVIPRVRLVGMPGYIGNGQAWRCTLAHEDQARAAWLFRRIGSRVPPGVLEVLADTRLVDELGLSHGAPVVLQVMSGP